MNSIIIKNYKQYICYSDDSTVTAIKKLNIANNLNLKCLIIVDKNYKIIGTATDGDIRRGILENISLSASISEVMNKNFSIGRIDDDVNNAKKLEKLRLTDKVPFLPIVNNNDTMDSILAISHAYKNNSSVLIMAGGLGKRLGKLTLEKPKPLVEVAGKPILQYVLDNIMSSKSDARRAIKSNALKINDKIISDERKIIKENDFKQDKIIKISYGKKKHYLIKII